jgi:uncharacterized SAM-binding protein YcdF (DUF218 family)
MSYKITANARELAKTLWNYQQLDIPLQPADVIIAMGCEDIRVAERAAQLFKDGFAGWVVCTGRSGERTKAMLQRRDFQTEAELFADVVQKADVPADCVLKEDKATNSGENIARTKELLAQKKIEPKRIIVVTVPYSERRQQATYKERWPEMEVITTSPQVTYETYPTEELSEDYLMLLLLAEYNA